MLFCTTVTRHACQSTMYFCVVMNFTTVSYGTNNLHDKDNAALTFNVFLFHYLFKNNFCFILLFYNYFKFYTKQLNVNLPE